MKHLTSISLVALAVALATPAAAERIGTAGAVNPDAQGTPPGGSTKTLNVGGNVVYRERITTTANGSVQLIFVDRTTLNIGPNSQLVIDEFVYDPKSNTGRMAATLTKGVMRFVGGQTSHTGGATIKTPATTLGVRGGVATIRHDASTGTRIINHFGTITAQTSTGTEIIRRPGFALNVTGANAAPTAPLRVARNEIDTNNRQLTSTGSQTGGRRETPTDQGASRNVGQANAPVTPTLVQGQQPQTTQQAAQVTTQPNTMQQEVPLQQVQQVATSGTQQTVTTTLPEIAPTPTPVLPLPRFYALLEDPTKKVGEAIPTAFDPGGTWHKSNTVGYGVGGTNTDGSPNTTSRMMAAGLVINGQGTTQTSAIFFANVDVTPESSAISAGGISAFNRLNSTARMGRLGASITSTAGGTVLDSAYSPTSLLVNDADLVNNTRQPGTGAYTNYSPTGQSTGSTYNYQMGFTRTTNPSGLGSTRPVGVLEGMIGGLWNTHSTNTGLAAAQSVPIDGGMLVDLNSASRFGAEFYVNRETYNSGPGDNFLEGTILFGYQGSGTRSRSAYVDYENFGARTTRENDGTVSGTSLSILTGNTPTGPVSQTPQNENGLMVNSSALGVQNFFPNVQFCQCEHTRWGLWSYTATRNGYNTAGAAEIVRDSVHLGTWLAGTPTPAVQLPTTGSATYTGHAIGSFKNGASEYLAAGNFASTVNFGSQSMTYSISNLDGRNYVGTGNFHPGESPTGIAASVFSGTATGTGGATMFTNGALFNGAAGPGGEIAGKFSVYGAGSLGNTAVVAPVYTGSGIFLGKR